LFQALFVSQKYDIKSTLFPEGSILLPGGIKIFFSRGKKDRIFSSEHYLLSLITILAIKLKSTNSSRQGGRETVGLPKMVSLTSSFNFLIGAHIPLQLDQNPNHNDILRSTGTLLHRLKLLQ
jgi:hypothetical protein